MQHLDPQPAGTNGGVVIVAAPVPDLLVGSHPVHETAVQKERDDSKERNWVVCRGEFVGEKSGLVRMGTGVVVHAAETARLCFVGLVDSGL